MYKYKYRVKLYNRKGIINNYNNIINTISHKSFKYNIHKNNKFNVFYNNKLGGGKSNKNLIIKYISINNNILYS
jgi:hypothetical protein